MAAEVLTLTGDSAIDSALIGRGAAMLHQGGLVAFPTETVYGLGADATNPEAVARVFAAKQRPADDPLIVHVAPAWPIDEVARIESSAVAASVDALIARFWPGPLTIVVERGGRIAPAVTSGGTEVAVRCPSHPVAQALIERAGVPVAAPSANRFGYVSPTTAAHVLADLSDVCDIVIDGGPCPIGIESTVVRPLVSGDVEILRPGAVTYEELTTVVARVVQRDGRSAASPGTLDRHYAPRAPAIAITADVAERLIVVDRSPLWGVDRGAYLGAGAAARLPAGWRWISLGSTLDLPGVAAHLYEHLRAVDRPDVDLIVLVLTGQLALGTAIDDRLRRAAAGHVARDLDELAGHVATIQDRARLADQPYAEEPNVRTAL